MADFLSNMNDGELDVFADQFWTTVDAAPATYAATSAQTDDLKSKKIVFHGDLAEHVSAQAAARSKTQAKDLSREEVENAVRFILKQARLNGVSDEDLAAAGVPVGGESISAPAATRPVGSVDTSQRFIQTINFADEAAPGSKRTPRGVLGCEIYQKIGGAPPADYKECIFRGLDTKTPYSWEFEAEDVGKMVHYMLRWRLRDESTSPWSETISATVTG